MHGPDHDPSARLAQRELEPLLSALDETLAREGLPSATVEAVFALTAGIYRAGHVQGLRQAVAEIAPEAARHGLHLWLAPDLETPRHEP